MNKYLLNLSASWCVLSEAVNVYFQGVLVNGCSKTFFENPWEIPVNYDGFKLNLFLTAGQQLY